MKFGEEFYLPIQCDAFGVNSLMKLAYFRYRFFNFNRSESFNSIFALRIIINRFFFIPKLISLNLITKVLKC